MKVINAELDGIDHKDHPDYCDAFVVYAEHPNGTPLTEAELDTLNEDHGDVVHELVWKHLY